MVKTKNTTQEHLEKLTEEDTRLLWFDFGDKMSDFYDK